MSTETDPLSLAKVIVGFAVSPIRPEQAQVLAIHLADCDDSVIVDEARRRIHVSQGYGRKRFRRLVIPFDDVLGFRAVEVQLGHNCASSPVNDALLQHSAEDGRLKAAVVFFPISIQLALRQGTTALLDLGTTATPLVQGLLHAELLATSVDGYVLLATNARQFVRRCNQVLARYHTHSEQRLAFGKIRVPPSVGPAEIDEPLLRQQPRTPKLPVGKR